MGLFDSKTEAATPKKRDDAKKKGQVAKSKEIVAVVVMIAGFMALKSSGPMIWAAWRDDLVYFLSEAVGKHRTEALQTAPLRVLGTLAVSVMPIFVAVMVAALVSNVGQTGPMLISDPLKWDFKKLNPADGMKKLFSPTSLVELGKSLAKVGLASYVLYGWLKDNYSQVLTMSRMELPEASRFGGTMIVAMFWKAINVLGIIAVVDFAWQKFSLENSLKMSKEEIKDEIKSQEGNMEVKGAIRRRQREMSRNRMIKAVRDADVVITNPTHYAVALKYDPTQMDAPQVVALGQRLVALRIREEAKEHRVPIVENPPLARALFAACSLGSLVPAELYTAVAEVLAFVFRLGGKSIGPRSVG